ncbi:MAG TPA: hypothetical protein VM736_03315, partial [Gemmatimonadales bacterium]|nr:hypothetical protein [Gemmatimonadales bacterium]
RVDQGVGMAVGVGVGVGWEAIDRGSGVVLGWSGPLDADRPAWAAPLFGFEVRLAPAVGAPVEYRPLPLQPPVERDLALVVPAGVSGQAVAEVLRRAMGPLLERLEVFDEYRGPGVPAGSRSLAWHCRFRDPERTLREGDVDALEQRGLAALEAELGVRRREA